jgi:hypothetical protein
MLIAVVFTAILLIRPAAAANITTPKQAEVGLHIESASCFLWITPPKYSSLIGLGPGETNCTIDERENKQ